MSVPRFRFAPSPTGSLHLGNARTALFNWLLARRASGVLVLRIEDTDVAREVEGAERAILEDLRWLRLPWDEGPDVGGSYGPYRQSERGERYGEAATRLLESDRAYRCFCDEAEGRERTAAGGAGYSGLCRGLDPNAAEARARGGEPHAIRFRTVPRKPATTDWTVDFVDRLRGPIQFSTAELGDPVLLRRDGRPTYNFAAVVDDLAMRITTVVRGDDHLSNTPRQVLLYRALGAEPPEFVHLPMVRGPDGERLSKRHGAVSVAELRRMGIPPDAVLNAIALLGWAPSGDRTVVSLEEMLSEFDVDRIGRSPAVFDPAKLEWLSGQYLHRWGPEEITPAVGERLVSAGRLGEPADGGDPSWLREVALLAQAGITRLDQAAGRLRGLFWTGGIPEEEEARRVLADPGIVPFLEGTLEVAEAVAADDAEGWHALLARVKARTDRSGKRLFQPVRVVLTGEAKGPELDRLIPLAVRGSRLHPDRIPDLPTRVRRTIEELRG